MKNNDNLIIEIMKNSKLSNLTIHELKVMRANMINSGTFTKYELAEVQYWIMDKEGRNPFTKSFDQEKQCK